MEPLRLQAKHHCWIRQGGISPLTGANIWEAEGDLHEVFIQRSDAGPKLQARITTNPKNLVLLPVDEHARITKADNVHLMRYLVLRYGAEAIDSWLATLNMISKPTVSRLMS